MFIDSAKIYVLAGKGGKGCRSFYRDKYTRYPIPDGGDGGKGSDIVMKADRNLHTLLDFQYRRHFFGKNGGHGSGKYKKGRAAPDLIIRLPCGTSIKDSQSGSVLRDLEIDQDKVVVARGGGGGRGNARQKEASNGQLGEERELLLDLSLLADVGIVGFPNCGKSTLISRISAARPKIAAYPFTTKFPVLGVVSNKNTGSFIVADIPGLIAGSSQGRGLGDKFLRHIQRTKVLIHLIDIAATEGRDPVGDYHTINSELKNYSHALLKKPQLIALNKIDLPGSKENLMKFKQAVKRKVYPVSALNGLGLEDLIEAVRKKL